MIVLGPVQMQEIATNYVWLKPICEKFPQVVPGGIILTDIFMYVDKLMNGKLLVKPDQDKTYQASVEAVRAKRLISSLRYLYRNSSLSEITEAWPLMRHLQPQ